MRLEISCHDRIGLTRELLDLLVSRDLDLLGIEVNPADGRIYLNFSNVAFEGLRALMAQIRRIDSITDVRTITFMPSERKNRALEALLSSLPDPLFTIDIKGFIELSNPAAQHLLGQTEGQLHRSNISQFIGGYNFTRWLDKGESKAHSQRLRFKQKEYLLEIAPLQLDNESNAVLVGAVVSLKSTARMGRQLHKAGINAYGEFSQLVAQSPQMQRLIEQAHRAAMLEAPLLIMGETGTGKDMLAHACHQNSLRGDQPFMALNCAALPDDVAESELFGHAAGAYPGALEGKKGFFEQANGGTVFLDEIGEMSSRMQTKLLRFLNDGTFRRVGEEKEVHVDIRVICATQKNLIELVQRGEFREDLYYRLHVLNLVIPPLRDRKSDIMPLATHFVGAIAAEQGMPLPQFNDDLMPYLLQYRWPGNVRQLKNVLYRALLQLEGPLLSAKDVELPQLDLAPMLGDDLLSGSLDEITRRFESSVLSRLYANYPSTRKLAKRLDVSHTAIANKLRDYGLAKPKSKEDE